MTDVPLGAVSSGSVISILLLMLASMVYGLWKALSNGSLCTGRELRDKDARLAAQAEMIVELNEQNRMMLNETIPTITSVLVALREAPKKAP